MLPARDFLQRSEPELAKVVKKDHESKTSANRKAVETYLDSHWQPNVTLVDLDWETTHGDLPGPHLAFTPLSIISEFTSLIPPNLRNSTSGFFNTFNEIFG